MVGREKGAVARMKDKNPDLISYHCINHHHVMNTMMRVINFLRASSSYQHRMLWNYSEMLMQMLMTFWCTTMYDGSAKTECWGTYVPSKGMADLIFIFFLGDEKKDIVLFWLT